MRPVRALTLALLATYVAAKPIDLSSLSGVASVHTTHPDPDVILIAQEHPNVKTVADTSGRLGTMPAIERICYDLFDRYAVKNLIVEGIEPYHVSGFKQGKTMGADGWFGLVERVIKSRDWNLQPGEDPVVKQKIDAFEQPIKEIQADFREEYREHLEGIYNQLFETYGRRLPAKTLGDLSQQAFDVARQRGERRLKEYLDDKFERFYDLHVRERDCHVARLCRSNAAKGEQTIVVYGARHVDSMRAAFDGLPAAVVLPEGLREHSFSVDPSAVSTTYGIAPLGVVRFGHSVRLTPSGVRVTWTDVKTR